MKVAVTGASGHVGANLVRELIAHKDDVRALVRVDTRAVDGLPVEKCQADILDADSLVRAFEGIEVVYHLAALISIEGEQGGRVHNMNVNGVTNVVNACVRCGVRRLVHFSSIHAFNQEPMSQPLDETRELATANHHLAYDRSKALGLKEALKGIDHGLEVVVVHPTAVMGPYDYKPSRMGEVLLDLYNKRLPSMVQGGFDWVDVRDICKGAIAAAEKGRSGEKYLLGGYYHTVLELAKVTEQVSGVKSPDCAVPQWMALLGVPFSYLVAKFLGKRPKYTAESLKILRTANPQVLHDKAARELGYDPRPLRETIADAYKWFRKENML